MNRPSLFPFITARALRILPAFWVALTVTAFVFAPGALLLSTGTLPDGFWSSATSYVFSGLDVLMDQPFIADTPSAATNGWNQSLWTLWWEIACYIIVAVLGFFGLLRRRTLLVLFTGALALAAFILMGVLPSHFLSQTARFLMMFAAGGAIYVYRERIPASWWGVGASVLIVGTSALLPDYRLIGALPLAYALIVGGSLLHRPALGTDLSYGIYIYAFPIQVGLVMLGVTSPTSNALLAIACTLPFALASWYLIERPALRLKTPLGDMLERASGRSARLAAGLEHLERA
jgi:peptidoglycan/LPS O-acetylase OafA/YrhL